MKKVSTLMVMALMGMGITNTATAAEPVKLEVGADLVSSYIWRGQDCAGLSIQPCATLTWEKLGLSLDAWASVELMGDGNAWANMSEFDWELAWTKGGLTLGLTDYNFCGSTYFSGWTWNSEATHNLEANLAYDFGPLAVAWNTVLTGPDHRWDDGEMKRNYSTYVELTAPWKVGEVTGSAAVGASLWDDEFNAAGTDGLKVCNIALTATKELFSLPVSASVIANPQRDKVFFVIGVSF